MSICSPCQKIKPILFCVNTSDGTMSFTVKVGTVLKTAGTDFFAFFKNIATGKVYTVPLDATSVSATYYQLSFTIGVDWELPADLSFEFWVGTLVSGNLDPNDRVSIIIYDTDFNGTGEVTADCFTIQGFTIYDLDGGNTGDQFSIQNFRVAT